MSHAVTIPKLGLTMEEATLVEWHVQDGEKVEKGQTLLTIETEKIMFDVEAEASGWLQRVAAVDSLLKVGDLAAHLRLRLPYLPSGRTWRRHRRWLVRSGHFLRFPLVRARQAGHCARHIRCRRR